MSLYFIQMVFQKRQEVNRTWTTANVEQLRHSEKVGKCVKRGKYRDASVWQNNGFIIFWGSNDHAVHEVARFVHVSNQIVQHVCKEWCTTNSTQAWRQNCGWKNYPNQRAQKKVSSLVDGNRLQTWKELCIQWMKSITICYRVNIAKGTDGNIYLEKGTSQLSIDENST